MCGWCTAPREPRTRRRARSCLPAPWCVYFTISKHVTTFSLADVALALESAELITERRGTLPVSASAITDDSRHVAPGSVFIAVRGTERDGHDFLPAALTNGAVAAIVEELGKVPNGLPAIVVRDGRRAAPLAAAAAYRWPARPPPLGGITGTNGETTTGEMLRPVPGAGHGRGAALRPPGGLLRRPGG